MSDNGYIQILHDLFRHPSFISAPPSYRCVLITILDRACHAPCKQDDHGVIIDLLPGQFLCTIRQLAELANVGRKDVEHAIARFSKIEILGQEVRHRKTIFTILWGIKLKSTGTVSGTTLGQDRDIKEEEPKGSSTKKTQKPYKDHADKTSSSSKVPHKKMEGVVELDKRIFNLIEDCKKREFPFSQAALLSVFKETSGSSLEATLKKFSKRSKNLKPLDLPDIWLRKNAIAEHEFELQKKEVQGII